MLYIFYGKDRFSLREELASLKRELDSDGALATNTATFSTTEATPEEVIAACDTVPFLGSRRLVMLEGALGAARRGRRRKSEGEGEDGEAAAGKWKALVEYVDRMPETTALVLIDEEAKNTSLLQSLRRKGDVRRLDLPKPNAAGAWVQQRAKKMKVELGPGVARAIAELVGNDTWALANELAKLRDYAAGRRVSVEDVRGLVAPAREIPPWELMDPIVVGRGAQALKALRSMLAQRNPLAISATIQGTYRQIAAAREMLDEGASTSELGQRLGLTGFRLEKLVEQASIYTRAMIADAYDRLLRADTDIKTGVFDDDVALELLVVDLADTVGRSRAA